MSNSSFTNAQPLSDIYQISPQAQNKSLRTSPPFTNFSDIFPGGRSASSSLSCQPLIFPVQLWPKVPYYPQIGRMCGNVEGPAGPQKSGVPDSCGATGICSGGFCQKKPDIRKTVFGIELKN